MSSIGYTDVPAYSQILQSHYCERSQQSRLLLRLLPCHSNLGFSDRSRSLPIPGFLAVTGGEYRTRERIHRAIADARLLAIPAS